MINDFFHKKYDISEVVVFVGPCSTGKSTLTRFASNSMHEWLSIDALIKYLGLGSSVAFSEIYDELQHYVRIGAYKFYDFGGSTISTLPDEFREKIFQLFKGAKVFNVRPSKSDVESYNFLKRFILAEKSTPKQRKQELLEGVACDLQSGVLEKFQTEPTIYTLDGMNKKRLLSPFVPVNVVRQEYFQGIVKLSQELKEKFYGKNSGQMGE